MGKPPAKTAEVFAYLVGCAGRLRTTSYTEVAKEVGLANEGVGRPLGWIRDEVCRPRGLPWLNALVVNQETWRPGERFLPDGFEMPDLTALNYFWRAMVVQVFLVDWSSVEFGA